MDCKAVFVLVEIISAPRCRLPEDEAAGFEIERVALEVMLDDSLYIDPDEFYEIEVTDTIPPENIRVMSADEYSI